MKKIISLLTLLFTLLGVLLPLFSIEAAAASNTILQNETIISSETIQNEDGTSVTIILSEKIISTDVASANGYNKSGSKSYICRDKKGNELWRFTVRGLFSIANGKSTVCIDSSYTINITSSSWENSSASSYCSGNQAIGDATFKEKVLFVTMDTRDCHVILSCDKSENLS